MADRIVDDLTAEIVRCHHIIDDLTGVVGAQAAEVERLRAALDAILDGARDPISVAQQARWT